MKKVTACLTALAMAGTVAATAATMAGCGKADLRILLLADNNEDSFYRQYFADLEEELGISIKYNGYEENSYDDKLKIEMTQGKTPDIFYVRPNDVIKYAKRLQSVEDYMTAQKASENPEVDFDDVVPAALDMYKYNETTKKMDSQNGKLYAFPKDLSTQQFGYNKTIVEKYTEWFNTKGYPLPWELGKNGNQVAYTWDEYKEICEHISNTPDGNNSYYGCDVPSIEIIAKSYGADIMNLETETVTITDSNFRAAVEYQANLCTAAEGKQAAADRVEASYANFTAGTVAFYSECGTWQIGAYNKSFNIEEGDDNWGVMPTPVKKNSNIKWQGMITSAGYVVSKDCNKPDLAKKVAASFMSKSTQSKLVSKGLMLPLLKSRINEYLKPENDDQYSPSTRSVFIDVINGEHGFVPVKYSTGDTGWLDLLDTALDSMYKSYITSNRTTTSLQYFQTMDFETLQTNMQNDYNSNNK